MARTKAELQKIIVGMMSEAAGQAQEMARLKKVAGEVEAAKHQHVDAVHRAQAAEARVSKLERKVVELRKEIVAAVTASANLKGQLDRVREVETAQAQPVTETTQKVVMRGPVNGSADGGYYGSPLRGRDGESTRHWLDD